MQRVLDRGPPPSVTLSTPEAAPASAPSEFQDAAAADDDSQWRFRGATIPDDPQARGTPHNRRTSTRALTRTALSTTHTHTDTRTRTRRNRQGHTRRLRQGTPSPTQARDAARIAQCEERVARAWSAERPRRLLEAIRSGGCNALLSGGPSDAVTCRTCPAGDTSTLTGPDPHH